MIQCFATRTAGIRCTVKTDLTLIGSQQTRNYIDKCRFACAILSNQTMHTAAHDPESNLFEHRSSEAFTESLDFKSDGQEIIIL
jgi:hypothetical protein